MEWVNLIIALLSGIAGGHVAGAAMPDKSLGGWGNTIAGLIGGAGGGWLLQALGLFNQVATAAASSGVDIGSIIANIGTGGVSGAILTAIVAYLKSLSAKA